MLVTKNLLFWLKLIYYYTRPIYNYLIELNIKERQTEHIRSTGNSYRHNT